MELIEKDAENLNQSLSRFMEILDGEVEFLNPNELDELMKAIESKRLEMKNKFSGEELLKYEEKFLKLSKEIKNKIDSVIEKLTIKQQNVQMELQKIYNKKKLIIYGR